MNRLALTLVAAMALGATAARADTFQLAFTSAADQSALGGLGITQFSGSATLHGTLIAPGKFNIFATSNTSITDPNFAAQTYTYLPNPSGDGSVQVTPDNFTNYDGLLVGGKPTTFGLIWIGDANGGDVNIFARPDGLFEVQDVFDQSNPNGPRSSQSIINLSIQLIDGVPQDVPEPMSLALLATGLAGLGFARGSRKG